MCTRVTRKKTSKVQFQSQHDFIMKYSSQSDFVSQQAEFLFQNFSQSMSTQYMQLVTFSQQYQNSQSVSQSIADSQVSQISQNLDSIVASSSLVNSVEKILSIFTDSKKDEKHTQFLSTMIDLNKAFRISCSVIKSSDEIVELNKQYTQANQSFDMNVIFMNLVIRLELHLRDLVEIDFRELFMKTTNNNDTILQH
jgi:hypothetical protein